MIFHSYVSLPEGIHWDMDSRLTGIEGSSDLLIEVTHIDATQQKTRQQPSQEESSRYMLVKI